MSKFSRLGALTIISVFAIAVSVGIGEARSGGGGGGGHGGGEDTEAVVAVISAAAVAASAQEEVAAISGVLVFADFRAPAFRAAGSRAATRRWDGLSLGFIRHRDFPRDSLFEISAG
ncbi:MAG: hypothetical protein WAK97_14105 [Pseudolabrys sp.]